MSPLSQETRVSLLYLSTLFVSGYDFYYPCSRTHATLRIIIFYNTNKICLGRFYLSPKWFCNQCRLATLTDFDSLCSSFSSFYVAKNNEVYAVCTF